MRWKCVGVIFCAVLLLTGCMYGGEQRMANQPPPENQLQQVQQSIEIYQEQNGVLPIHTFDEETPLFHRYAINFSELVPRHLSEPPPNSFEAGGLYRYVLVNVEEDPQVKLIDLQISRQVSNVQKRVNDLLREGAYLPVDEDFGGGYFSLDYGALNLREEPVVSSPFSGQSLSLIVDQRGEVGVDYRPDLYQLLNLEELQVEEGDDIRHDLVEDHPFVPAHSFPYTLEDEHPVFIESWNMKN